MLRGLFQACLAPFRNPWAALRSALLLVGIPLFVIVGAHILGLFAWMGMTAPGDRASYYPDSAPARVAVWVLLLDWQAIIALLAFAYSTLVGAALLRDLSEAGR